MKRENLHRAEMVIVQMVQMEELIKHLDLDGEAQAELDIDGVVVRFSITDSLQVRLIECAEGNLAELAKELKTL
jgi:hypothetical protein